MSVADIIWVLERAQGYQQRYPGLSVECAVGLTGLDLGPAERYAPLFEGCRLFEDDLPEEIPEKVRDDVRGRFGRMQQNLRVEQDPTLDPGDPEAISKAIGRLRQRPTD